MKYRLMQFLFGGPGTPSPLGDFGLLVLRVAFGAYIALHGWDKLHTSGGSFGLNEQLLDGLRQMQIPAPTLMGWLCALTEFVGGILVVLGFLTRPAALALVVNMSVAAFKAHGADPWYNPMGRSKESALLYLAPFVLLLLAGAGRFSVDRFFRRSAARAQVRELNGS